MKERIDKKYSDDSINLALDTIKKEKQGLVFVNTRRSAESTAEKISLKITITNNKLMNLSDDILHVLQSPTKQCKRLAMCVKKGIAFHHSGLTHKQRELIEDNFRNGNIKIICCTPTLCLSKDTKIWHNTSETEVSKFKNSNSLFVLSKSKLINMKAQKVQKIDNSSKLIQISSVSGYSIKVTPNHKMLIKRKNKKQIIIANNITKNDKIATIGKLNISKIINPTIKEFIIDNKMDIENCKFDSGLSYFIGVMLGDGYSGIETNGNKIKYKGSPCVVGIDNEIFQKVKEICGYFNLNYRENKNHNGTPQIIFGKNKWFREFLLRCGVEKRERKHISEKLMEMDFENTASLLRGLFDTDGHLNKRVGPGFSNISIELIKQIQKLLLRFGIVSSIRKKKASSMKIYEKEYKTVPCFELNIHQKKSILDFYKFIGFNVKRKQEALINLVARICSNLNYVYCPKCDYKIYGDLFSGRTKDQKKWGKIKLKIIKLLGEKEELGSRELKKLLNHEPKKKENRLNHHYELIKKRRIGNRSNTEWIWSLNKIGNWVYKNLICNNIPIITFFALQKCPLCKNNLDWIIKKGWRDSDFDGDIFWDKIRKIKQVDVEEVYDVVLSNKPKNDHMFVANGFIVHNSYGLDLPAFRTIIRDLYRYGGIRGSYNIPVLEYLQMSGRAGRPRYDSFGESITIAKSKSSKESIVEKYIKGEPEEIVSKLAVEPVLRTYVLSLIAGEFVNSKKELLEFFEKTFYAQQYEDMEGIERILTKMIHLLEEWEFLKSKKDDFVSADKLAEGKLEATLLGKRVSELYIDPLTAFQILTCLRKASSKIIREFSFLHTISSTLEIRPLLRARMAEYDEIQEKIAEFQDYLLINEPNIYEPEYDEFINTIKTAMIFQEWTDEKDEEFLLEKYNVRPGELRAKMAIADWLLYATEELARLLQFHNLIKEVRKTRFRLKYGIKEELMPLVKLRNIGRVRARTLFKNKIKDIGDVKKVDFMKLAQLIGKNTAVDVKKQVGQDFSKMKVKENKRKGQISIKDF